MWKNRPGIKNDLELKDTRQHVPRSRHLELLTVWGGVPKVISAKYCAFR
jgi:hypothetical protein